VFLDIQLIRISCGLEVNPGGRSTAKGGA
jgi:hypothetical protein